MDSHLGEPMAALKAECWVDTTAHATVLKLVAVKAALLGATKVVLMAVLWVASMARDLAVRSVALLVAEWAD